MGTGIEVAVARLEVAAGIEVATGAEVAATGLR